MSFSKTTLALAAVSLTAAAPLLAQTNLRRPRLDPDDAYKNNCMRCHIAMPQFRPGGGQTVVMHMRVRANLTKEETDAILEYLTGGSSTPSSREARRAERPESQDREQVTTATVGFTRNPAQTVPAQPATRPLPPAAAARGPAETITIRSADGSPVGEVSRDPAAGTLTLRTQHGEHGYLLDAGASALMDRDSPGAKLYLSWRFDKEGRPEPILRVGASPSTSVVLRSAPRADAVKPLTASPAGPSPKAPSARAVATPAEPAARALSSPVAATSTGPAASKPSGALDVVGMNAATEKPSGPPMGVTEKPATGPESKPSAKVPEPASPIALGAAPASTAVVTRTTTTTKPRLIEVIADKDNKFRVPGESKPILKVKPGEKVVLRITSHFGGEKGRDDAVHSFAVKKLRDQGWDIRLYEGTKDYPLVAPQSPGEYVVECTVKCGPGHDEMRMKLVVGS